MLKFEYHLISSPKDKKIPLIEKSYIPSIDNRYIQIIHVYLMGDS